MALKINQKLVLASQSPSRKMLLEQAGISLDVIVSGADETVPESYTPAQTVECLAERKAMAVEPLCHSMPIIAADSVVSIDGMIIGKPANDAAARATLHRLSNRTHDLYTGVCLCACNHRQVFHVVTKVTFYPLTSAEIDEYVALGESTGRAGGYGIEGIGVMLVKGIVGDYTNIVGLPVAETLRRLRAMLDS